MTDLGNECTMLHVFTLFSYFSSSCQIIIICELSVNTDDVIILVWHFSEGLLERDYHNLNQYL